MKEIYFVTGNKNKLREAKQILDIEIQSIKLDLPEVQSIDVKEVVREKVITAYNKIKKPVFVEDTGLCINEWENYPGALIKWLLETVGNEGIVKMLEGFNNKSAYAETAVAYYDGKRIYIFNGIVKWKITKPKTESKFGWDPIFEVDGLKKTYGEMTPEEKNNISMRGIALQKMKKVDFGELN